MMLSIAKKNTTTTKTTPDATTKIGSTTTTRHRNYSDRRCSRSSKISFSRSCSSNNIQHDEPTDNNLDAVTIDAFHDNINMELGSNHVERWTSSSYSIGRRSSSSLRRPVLLLLLIFHCSATATIPWTAAATAFLPKRSAFAPTKSSFTLLNQQQQHPQLNIVGVMKQLRGGGSSTQTTSVSTQHPQKKKKKRRTTKKADDDAETRKEHSSADDVTTKQPKKQRRKRTNTKEGTDEVILEDEEDLEAKALGDAIRKNAADHPDISGGGSNEEIVLESLSCALGNSDRTFLPKDTDTSDLVSISSVLANYFLKSHGGAHGIQSICSILSVISGLISVALLPCASSPLQLTLLRRCLLFAMMKHTAGLLGASFVAGKAIPSTGYQHSRALLHAMTTNPIAQYLFYTSTLLVWLPVSLSECWWKQYRFVPVVLVGPVLLREMVSTILVACDVLVLWATCSDNTNTVATKIVTSGQDVVNAVMSIVVTSKKWRSISTPERQVVLAQLVSKICLLLEVVVGCMLCIDILYGVSYKVFLASPSATTAAVGGTPTLLQLLKRMMCTRLYMQYLWTRRRKVTQMVTSIRGGGSAGPSPIARLPFYMLDILLDPMGAMGISTSVKSSNGNSSSNSDTHAANTSVQDASIEQQQRSPSSSTLQSNENRRDSTLDWKEYIQAILDVH